MAVDDPGDRDERQLGASLNDALDALAGDTYPTSPRGDGARLAGALAWLRARDDALDADPAFAGRLLERLTGAARGQLVPLPVVAAPSANGRVYPGASLEDLAPPVRSGRRQAWFELAAAVLLIVALGGVAAGYGGWPLPRADRAGGDWTMHRGGAARTGAVEGTGIAERPGLLWSFVPEAPNRPTFVIGFDTLYLAGDERAFYALDARTGRERWRFDATDALTGGPALAGQTVVVGSRDGMLTALDARSGALRWQIQTGGAIRTSPAIVDDVLYLGNAAGSFFALSLVDGAERWRFHQDGLIWSSAAVADGLVFAGDNRHVLHALDAATGEERWRFVTAGTGVVPVPAVADGVVYATSWDGALYALDAATGDERWRFAAGRTLYSPAVAGGLVVTGGHDGTVYALDAASGQRRWTFTTGEAVVAQPVVIGDGLYVGSTDGIVYALDLATGAERWRVGLARVAFGPVVVDEALYIVALDGRVLALAVDLNATPLTAEPPSGECLCGIDRPWSR